MCFSTHNINSIMGGCLAILTGNTMTTTAGPVLIVGLNVYIPHFSTQLIIACCWNGLLTSMNPCGRRTICRKTMPMVQWQLQFESVALLFTTYLDLVHLKY